MNIRIETNPKDFHYNQPSHTPPNPQKHTDNVSQQIPKSRKGVTRKFIFFLFLLAVVAVGEYFLVTNYLCPKEIPEQEEAPSVTDEDATPPRGIMMLIEYKDTEGLVNFVHDLYQRDIYSLLSVSPDFVEENCDVIKTLLDYKVEIVSQNPSASFWDVPYEEQYEDIKNSKEKIETCTGRSLRVVSSRYFASDENTVKVAEELGIPYVLARGTTGTEATVFKPEEYDVTIISVSNIPSIKWMYGSLCDYSYWVREGTPEDIKQELIAALDNNKVTPVSHTNLGGMKAQWNEMWLDFFNNYEVNWQSLDEFATADMTLPMWQIPRNKNAPYTPTQRPLTPYDEEENINNPCAIDELPTAGSQTEGNVGEKIVFFHNGTGPMCLDFLDFLGTTDYPTEEHLNTEDDFQEELEKLSAEYGTSEGISTTFGYYPIIFIKDKAYSGFNNEIENEISQIISGI